MNSIQEKLMKPMLEEGLRLLHLIDRMGGFEDWYNRAGEDDPYRREIDRRGLEEWRRED